MTTTELHQQCFSRGRRSYYFDIKMTRQNQLYLVFSENIRETNEWKRHKIMVFEEDAEEFAAYVQKSLIQFRLLVRENAKSKTAQAKNAKRSKKSSA